nr:MAG TPA: hypothetical protein [Bacteriophage sp.]
MLYLQAIKYIEILCAFKAKILYEYIEYAIDA